MCSNPPKNEFCIKNTMLRAIQKCCKTSQSESDQSLATTDRATINFQKSINRGIHMFLNNCGAEHASKNRLLAYEQTTHR